MRLVKPSGALILYRLKRLFNLRSWNTKLLMARLTSLMLVLVAAALVSVYFFPNHKTAQDDALKNLKYLIKQGDCQKGLDGTRNETPSPDKADYAIELLYYRAGCQEELQYDQAAMGSLRQLSKYLELQKRFSEVIIVQERITDVQNSIRQQVEDGKITPKPLSAKDKELEDQLNKQLEKFQ